MEEFKTERLVVILIKPANYDDMGFPQRYWRGTIPSNSLMVMRSLTEAAVATLEVPSEVYALEDGIAGDARQLHQLLRRFPQSGTQVVVGLVGVQTNQFRRAQDIALIWQAAGAAVVIGGFHVSGLLATFTNGGISARDKNRSNVPCPECEPADMAWLREHHVIVFAGEAEHGRWLQVLCDILNETPLPLYQEASGSLPELRGEPLPQYPASYTRRFVDPMGALETCRGCPFTCSFCSIINVQGRQSRFRDPQAIIVWVKENYERYGSFGFFLTDDNFARNPEWETILDGLIDLQERGYAFQFLIEADLACWKMKSFIPKLARAGCCQIFMGVESMNEQNLAAESKRQNKIASYQRLWALCHEYGIVVHAGYIIGFPHDTPSRVYGDVDELHRQGVDLASFFMLTPLPGSEDHVRAYSRGVPIDEDPNRFDSFHAVIDHPLMSREEWQRLYQRVWAQFYSIDLLIERIAKFHDFPKTRRQLLKLSIWYRWAFISERAHPMVAGLFRVRSWRDRSPRTTLLYNQYLGLVVKEWLRYIPRFLAEFYRFQYVIFETEYAPAIRRQTTQAARQLSRLRSWCTPRAWALWARLTFAPRYLSRRWLNSFWVRYAEQRWRLLFNPAWHLLALPHGFTEVVYTIRFSILLIRQRIIV